MGKAPRRRPDAVGSVNDGREAVGPVMAVAGEAADARAIPAHHQPIAVCLISWTQSGPDGGRATFDGRHGSMKPEGRRKTTEDRRFRLRRWLRGINFTVHRKISRSGVAVNRGILL